MRSSYTTVSWTRRYEQLVAYKEEHGDCLVPQKWAGNPALGKWVDSQRQAYKQGRLKEDRIEMLEDVGFTWSVR